MKKNLREYTCKSSSLMEELIPPVLYNGEKCIPLNDYELQSFNKHDEGWVTSLTFTKDDILNTIDFLKVTYGKSEEFADFFEIVCGKHQKVEEQYLYYGKIYNYKTDLKESKNKYWARPRNVGWPDTKDNIMSLFDCDLGPKLKYDKYDVAWCFSCNALKNYSNYCSYLYSKPYRICRKVRLYIYDPMVEHTRAPIKIRRKIKPKYR